MMAALLLGSIAATEIEAYFLGLTPLLIVAVVAAGFVFAGSFKEIDSPAGAWGRYYSRLAFVEATTASVSPS